jgi:hypothetical protein
MGTDRSQNIFKRESAMFIPCKCGGKIFVVLTDFESATVKACPRCRIPLAYRDPDDNNVYLINQTPFIF